jgi:tRNA uridine 5-carboxymethylaminomethyl modification enzyme
MNNEYDVIVIGGGHAGCEAALASARMGCKTLLLTMNVDSIGLMPCNPAIGGLAKGQLVKEIDALGGQMGKATDATAIQFRTLNMSKGPAVRSSRAQVDRHAYQLYMRSIVETQPGLDIKQGLAEEMIRGEGNYIRGIRTSLDETFYAKAIVITPGTFLNGLIHIGLEHFPGGRIDEKPSSSLSNSLKDLGLKMGRLKTGTCARIDGRTINFDILIPQHGDKEISPFSFTTKQITRDQLPCYITHTNKNTHDIIRENLNRSPLFTGIIKGTGVRYCPSIEDKIYRFPERDSHHVFLEPEGLNTIEYYPNGISTSLPVDVQERIVHSIKGLENARITRPGYGIEYDFVDPTQLYPTLEAKTVPGLYLGGQINGTTGYEEAASLGLMAGINAALKVKSGKPLILDRSQSYIAVLIDDLVTKGTNEPYRMFTSRVEYRLLIREDNADLRLTPIGYEIGLIDEERYARTVKKKERIEGEIRRLKESHAEKVLRRPGISYSDVTTEEDRERLSPEEAKVVEIEIKYEGFIRRQLNEIDRFEKIERICMPENMDYKNIPSISAEIQEKLTKIKPANLGQASRISGVTPAAISILMVYLEKIRRERRNDSTFMKPYNDYNTYLKERFGEKVYRIGIDAGFGCPNRDGTKGTGGCIYCDENGSRALYAKPAISVPEQLKTRIDYLKKEKGAGKFIAYFQAFTNTYAPADQLKKTYDQLLPFEGIVGLSIGTRPDAVDSEKLKLIASYKDRYETWIEYGLQSSHDKTLKLLNRGHSYEDFAKAVKLAKEHSVRVCTHVILGLPGEARDDIIATAKKLSELKIDGIKIHLLHVLKGSALEKLYLDGEIKLLSQDEYAELACDFLENLSKDIIVQRLTGQGSPENHVAPDWALNKLGTIRKMEEAFAKRGTCQGYRTH